jgi:diguanylate cyclase (GGDEF)-like protein/PAS domain S-box-containing protein
LAAALGALGDAVMVTSADRPFPGARIEWVNDAFEQITGWSSDDACGRSVRLLLGPGTDRDLLDRLAASLEEGRPAREELVAYRRDGSPFVMELSVSPIRDAAGRTTHHVALHRDVTALLHRVELLERRARTDPLTGLGNRRLLLLELGTAAAAQQPEPLGVLMIDIDRFKDVNDTHGHAAGDEVLAEVARRIAAVVRGHDVVARWGGEEFCVLLPDVASNAEVLEVAERIRGVVAQAPIRTAAGEIDVTVSVGAVRTRPGLEPPELIGSADRALYSAKDAGRNRVELDDGSHLSDFAV